MKCKEVDVPIISSMGAGNKLDASAFRVTDIYKTKVCPLAKVMRRELKKRGVKKLKVVYSEEEPIRPMEDTSDNCSTETVCQDGVEYKAAKRRSTPGSDGICTVSGRSRSLQVRSNSWTLRDKKERQGRGDE